MEALLYLQCLSIIIAHVSFSLRALETDHETALAAEGQKSLAPKQELAVLQERIHALLCVNNTCYNTICYMYSEHIVLFNNFVFTCYGVYNLIS